MNRLSRLSSIPMLMTLICAAPMGAQDSEKINSSLGSVVSVPMGPTSDLATLGWGFTAGVGYNLSRRNSVIGEFLWNRLYSTSGAAIANGAGGSSGGASDIYSVTGNYRFELRGKKFGTYFIGGGGWYLRQNHLEHQVAIASGTTCTTALVWWGAHCTSGTVTSNQTLNSYGSNTLGGNAGLGFTWMVGEPSYRLYIESRYHYAPTNNINTQFVACTIGLRY
jgi:hypothetical protein